MLRIGPKETLSLVERVIPFLATLRRYFSLQAYVSYFKKGVFTQAMLVIERFPFFSTKVAQFIAQVKNHLLTGF